MTQLRVDEIIFVGGALGDGLSISYSLREFIKERSLEEIQGIIPDLNLDIEDGSELDDDEFVEEVVGALMGNELFGFLVRCETPQISHLEGTSAISVDWGVCYSAWFYGDTVEEALDKAIEWANTMHGRDLGTSLRARNEMIFPF